MLRKCSLFHTLWWYKYYKSLVLRFQEVLTFFNCHW